MFKVNDAINPDLVTGQASSFFGEEDKKEKSLYKKVVEFVKDDLDKKVYYDNIFVNCDLDTLTKRLSDMEFFTSAVIELIEIRKMKRECVELTEVLGPLCSIPK